MPWARIDRPALICYCLHRMSCIRKWVAEFPFLWSLLIAAGVSAPTPLHGIEIQPTPGQISATVERGRAAAAQGIAPDQLHVWFGSEKDLAPVVSS